MNTYLGATVFQNALLFCVPILLAALGALIMEKGGILNLGIEGMVTLAAATTFVITYETAGNAMSGVLVAVAVTLVVGALLAHLTVDRRLDQATVGLATLVLCLGGASLAYRLVIGVQTSAARIETLPTLQPTLAEIPYVGRIVFQQPWPVWAALAAIIPIWWVINRTNVGLRLRATGENPKSVDSLGISVRRIRYLAVLAGSTLIALAGACYPLLLAGGWAEGTVGGRGWLALLVVILARWRVGLLLPAAFTFAYLDAISFSLAIQTDAIPSQVVQMVPFLAAIVVIASSYGRARAPAALAKAYDREARF